MEQKGVEHAVRSMKEWSAALRTIYSDGGAAMEQPAAPPRKRCSTARRSETVNAFDAHEITQHTFGRR